MLFCPCVVRKTTTHVGTKALNMHHQAQMGFRGIVVGIPQHQKGYHLSLRTLRTIAHSLMVHIRVLEAYIHFELMYTTYQIFPVLPMKDMINKDGDATTPFKLATGTKPSVSHLRMLFVHVL